MRDLLKAGLRRVASAWFWPLALLALPNCFLETGGIVSDHLPPHLITGALPHSSAIMCDIEKYQATRRCATPQDLAMGIRLTAAAEALVSGQSSSVGLDYSLAAQTACGDGHPQAVDFEGQFPEGLEVCINGDLIGDTYLDVNAVCFAQCRDLVEHSPGPMPPDIAAFCLDNGHAQTSTHFSFDASGPFGDACSEGGTLRPGFADPRRIPEPVVWTDFVGTSAVGSNLTRDAATTGNFDAGAVSTQWIHGDDGYVEFEASETNQSHVIGLAQTNGCPLPCPDSDAGITNINFAISLNLDGRFYVLEGGALVPGPDVNQSFGTYAAGERFRVHVREIDSGHATVSYSRVIGACVPGNPCIETVFYMHVGSPAMYPLRVDTSFREQSATLANVTFVRIQ